MEYIVDFINEHIYPAGTIIVKEGEIHNGLIKSHYGRILVSYKDKELCEIAGDNFLNLFELLNKTKSI